jgi:hypothetical protein
MDKSIKIDGYTVTFMEYDETNNCYIEKGKLSGSLALVENLGGLEDDCGNILEINPSTIEKIQTWADAQGY